MVYHFEEELASKIYHPLNSRSLLKDSRLREGKNRQDSVEAAGGELLFLLVNEKVYYVFKLL